MTFRLENVKRILTNLAKMCEDLWLERHAFQEALIRSGLSAEQVEELAAQVKKDPEARAQAHEAFTGIWKSLEGEGREALIEDLSKKPFSSDKPN